MSLSSPCDRRGFEIAIICALPLEAECVQAVFTKFWNKIYGKAAGDPNAYTTGVIENHNVVLAYMPKIGVASASGTAASLRSSFPNIRLALMVGVCGGVPYDISCEKAIFLGDIIISETPVHYRFGSQYPERFKRNTTRDGIGRSSLEVRTIIAQLKTGLYCQTLQNSISEYLLIVQQEVQNANYPGSEFDKLYESTYRHKHQDPEFHVIDDECAMGERHICSRAHKMDCGELQCAADRLVRCRLTDKSGLRPSVHFGKVGSGDTVMKSAEDRDRIAGEDGVIAFEMEAAGVWDHFPSVLTIKGVCDYADSHKDKLWQPYAAATAAACLKAFLKVWVSGDQHPDEGLISVPLQRNINFVGRDQILQKIHEEITSHRFQRSDCIQFPIFGMGGIGKTQTILEYAYRYRKTFSSVFWVNANTYDSAVASYFTIAQTIGLASIRYRSTGNTMTGEDAEIIVCTVKEWLVKRENSNWLLLFDNWDNLEDEKMDQLMPIGGSGVILITSRRQGWARTRHSLEIPEMEEEACLLLLSNGASTEYWESDLAEYDAAKEIVKMLGYLPLAIDQAGAHIHTLKIRAKKYLSRLIENAETLNWTPPRNLWPYRKTVLSCWDLTFREIENEYPKAFDILRVCAFLAGEDMSENLLRYGFDFAHMGELALAVEDVMGILFSFSLAKRNGSEDGFSMHAMIQTCIRAQLSLPEKQKFVEIAVLVVAGAVRKLSLAPQQDWVSSRQLLSHAERCGGHLNHSLQHTEGFRDSRASFILGQFCDRFSRHDRAISWFKKDLDAVSSSSLLRSLEDRDGIATAMLNKGQLNEALAEFRSLYTEATNNLGEEHLLTNKIANTLGITYKKLGQYQNALEFYEISLKWVTKKFGDADQRTLKTLNNTAIVLKELKEYTRALRIFEDVLRKKEAALGMENPSTLETVMNIGVLYGHLGRYDDALRFLRRALSGKEKCWGKDDPKTMDVKGNIANVYLKSGRLEDAIELHHETYNGYKEAYGSMHHTIFTTADRLGESYCKKGWYAESLRWYSEALSGRGEMFGQRHTTTLETVANMAGVFQLQGRL